MLIPKFNRFYNIDKNQKLLIKKKYLSSEYKKYKQELVYISVCTFGILNSDSIKLFQLYRA